MREVQASVVRQHLGRTAPPISVRASRSDGFFVFGCIYLDHVILHGTIQKTPEPGAKSVTYDDAHQTPTATIPNDWRLIAIRRD